MVFRARFWMSIAQFVMIFILMVQEPANWLYVPFILIGLMVITVVDWVYIFSNEQKRIAEKNPVMMEILERIKRIEGVKG